MRKYRSHVKLPEATGCSWKPVNNLISDNKSVSIGRETGNSPIVLQFCFYSGSGNVTYDFPSEEISTSGWK
jgi:hypothetical protein